MIDVLLVDDNRFALEYFSGLIQWEKYGFRLVGTALDGEFAYAQFLTYSPRVVITDIQMPNIDGIGLAKKIFQKAPDTVIIFLSSYEEFKYAKSALQMGVYDYILKHEVTEENLREKLMDIEKIIRQNAFEHRCIDEANLLYLINDCSSPMFKNNRQIFNHFSGQYDLSLIIQDHIYPEFSVLCTSPEREIAENDIKSYLYQYSEVVAAVRVEKFTYVLLTRSTHPFYDTASIIISGFRNKFSSTISMVLVCDKTDIRNCFRDYPVMLDNIDCKFFYLPSSILHNDVFQPNSTSITIEEDIFLSLAEKENYSGLCSLIQEKLRLIILQKDRLGFEKLTRIAVNILTASHKNIVYCENSMLFQLSDVDSGIYWYDAASIFQWLLNQFTMLQQVKQEKKMLPYSHVVNNILVYIYKNYQNSDLSVENIAGHFQLNMNQLNYVFKKEVGETVIKTMIRIRMERAKQLLDERQLRISEIGEAVGYNSVSYFSSVFKKYYGFSPQEYRRKCE